MKHERPVTMRTRICSILLFGLAGCASAPPLPPEATSVALVPVSSSAIEVHRPRFLMKRGYLELEAYVFRQWKADTTADSHVDLLYLDALGRTLLVETATFAPRSLPRTLRMPQPHALLRVGINLPRETAAIEVRGHDGPHRDGQSKLPP